MSKNVIYRGPVEHDPRAISMPCAAPTMPGIFVTSDGSELTAAANAKLAEMLLVGNNDYAGQSVDTEHQTGDVATAYTLTPGQQYAARVAAGTYAHGAALTVTAGQMAAAVAGDVVVAWFADDQAGVALSANDLADVTIANAFVKA